MADEILKMVPEQMDQIIQENKKKEIEYDIEYDKHITKKVDKIIKSLPHQIAQNRLAHSKKRWIRITNWHIESEKEAMDILGRIRAVGFKVRYCENGHSSKYYRSYRVEMRDREVPDFHCAIL